MLKYNKLKQEPFRLKHGSDDVVKHHYCTDVLIISTVACEALGWTI